MEKMMKKTKVQEQDQIESALNDNIRGMVQLDEYHGTTVPLDQWEIIKPLDDIIMAEYVDTEDGQTVVRGGIHLANSMVQQSWRACKALLVGPNVRNIKEGDYFLCPNDKGIPAINRTVGKKQLLLFINEPRIFCKVKPKK